MIEIHSPTVKQLVNKPAPDRWRTMRFRRGMLLISFFDYIFLSIAITSLVTLSKTEEFFVWIALVALPSSAAVWLLRTPCPAGGRKFFYRHIFTPFSLLRSRCAHCGVVFDMPIKQTLEERLEIGE